MVTVRDLKAMLGLDTSNFLTGMREASRKTQSFKNSLKTAAKNFENLEVIINTSKIDVSKIPKGSVQIKANKKALVDSIKDHLTAINKPPHRTIALDASKASLRDSVKNWVSSIKKLPELPFKINETSLKESITDAIKKMSSFGGAFFRRNENKIPLQVDLSASGKKAAANSSGKTLTDIHGTLEKILDAIGTEPDSLKTHVDDAGGGGGIESMFGGGGGMFG